VIDTHCHLDVDAFAGDRAAVLARAQAAGVRGLLVRDGAHQAA
jgi:TatD DNase family protein